MRGGILERSVSSVMRVTPPLGNRWTSSFPNGCESAIGTVITKSLRAVRAVTVMVTSSRSLGIKKDGSGVSIEFSIVPLQNGTGELTGLAAIMRDVTKRFEDPSKH